MQVTVTDNKMQTKTYGYAPDHFADLVEYYSHLVQSGQIYSYTVKMQGQALRHIGVGGP